MHYLKPPRLWQFSPLPLPATLKTSAFVFSITRHVYTPGARDLIFRAVEDADLIRQAGGRSGPAAVEAFNLLVSRWEKRVYNYLLRIAGNREDALDLTQDVFLKAYQNLRKLDDPGRFAPWLYRIAHNEAYSLFRKRRPEASSEANAEPEATGVEVTVGGSSVFPIELTLAVSSALNRLSPDQREAVVLKIYQGFKFEEISEILQCPVSTIKSRVYTALELLKAELAPITRPNVSEVSRGAS
jgi:RNA polymerase sigma-70 factor, ECF subfamily